MSYEALQAQSNPLPPAPDFTALASALQEAAQALLDYGKTPKAEMSSQIEQKQQVEQDGQANLNEQSRVFTKRGVSKVW